MSLNPPQDYRKTAFTHRRGTSGLRPNATDVLPGTLYFSTDTGVIERSNGLIWESYSGSGGSSSLISPVVLGLDSNDDNDDRIMIPGPRGLQGFQGIQGVPGLDGMDGEDRISPFNPVKFQNICMAFNSVAQSIITGTNIQVTFDTVLFDNNSIFAANNFTIKDSGVYHIVVSLIWLSGGGSIRQIGIVNNGGNLFYGFVKPNVTIPDFQQLVTYASLARGDVLQLFALQDSGINVDLGITTPAFGTRFSVVGPVN